MKTKHTDGNWQLNNCIDKYTVSVEENKGWKIVATCTQDHNFISEEEMKANALLISKSPKLLATLEKIKDKAITELHRQAMNNEAIDKLLGAIAEIAEVTINEATGKPY